MDYILQLKNLNVKFEIIGIKEAKRIMESEYSYYKLLEYSVVFERYHTPTRKGQFINTDFAELYYLALIDSKLSGIMMKICLEIEQYLKTKFLWDVNTVGDAQKILEAYYNSDKEYLEKNYISENYEILQTKYDVSNLSSLDIYKTVDVIQFGTLEHMLHFFYKTYAEDIFNSRFAPFEKLLISVRHIRNAVAHNNSLLGQIDKKSENKSLELLAFLGRNGIKSRTLQTNMSKMVICELCNVLYMYYKYIPGQKMEISREIECLDKDYCQRYGKFFEANYTLESVYHFLTDVYSIFVKIFVEKTFDK